MLLFAAVVRLRFLSSNYTFAEGEVSSTAVITIVIDNYFQLMLSNDVSVTVFPVVANSNATEGTGMCIIISVILLLAY